MAEYRIRQSNSIIKNTFNFVYEIMSPYVPEIGTWQFYVVICTYIYILMLAIYFFKIGLYELVHSKQVNDIFGAKSREEEEIERKKRQKEAEEILRKHFTVSTIKSTEIEKKNIMSEIKEQENEDDDCINDITISKEKTD